MIKPRYSYQVVRHPVWTTGLLYTLLVIVAIGIIPQQANKMKGILIIPFFKFSNPKEKFSLYFFYAIISQILTEKKLSSFKWKCIRDFKQKCGALTLEFLDQYIWERSTGKEWAFLLGNFCLVWRLHVSIKIQCQKQYV